jgi:hypothetical protein
VSRGILIALAMVLTALPARAADPKTCSEAAQACLKPFGRHCDGGCQATCQLRLNGCLKTGSFSDSGKLWQNLKKN